MPGTPNPKTYIATRAHIHVDGQHHFFSSRTYHHINFPDCLRWVFNPIVAVLACTQQQITLNYTFAQLATKPNTMPAKLILDHANQTSITMARVSFFVHDVYPYSFFVFSWRGSFPLHRCHLHCHLGEELSLGQVGHGLSQKLYVSSQSPAALPA